MPRSGLCTLAALGALAVARAAAAQPDALPPAESAVAALDRASAAYEYGDLNQVVEATRPIYEGAIPATEAERVQALRLYGVGLFLTNRAAGAEPVFLELLRLRPKMRLDPTTTRPEAVAFFEEVRRRHRLAIEEAARARARRSLGWAFLPPVGQFKNGDAGRGYAILGLEVLSLAGLVTTKLVLDSWVEPGNLFTGRERSARTLRTLNHVSAGVLAATYVVGVVDALLRRDRDPDEPALTLVLLPAGAGVGVRF